MNKEEKYQLLVKQIKGTADITPVAHRVLPDFYTRFMTPTAFWRMMDIKSVKGEK